jgi:antitoxin VapB
MVEGIGRMVEMAAALNIKNAEAVRLAQELAQETGETLTEAVVKALQERLQRVSRRERLARMREISHEMASRFKEPWKSIDHAELLYDSETGLPK